MNKKKNIGQSQRAKQRMILEMIDASWELAERLGEHPLRAGCNCICCVNKRKRILEKPEDTWKFSL